MWMWAGLLMIQRNMSPYFEVRRVGIGLNKQMGPPDQRFMSGARVDWKLR